jgi:hypothetical protein
VVAVAIRLLGAHRAEAQIEHSDIELWDALDAVIETDSGESVLFGVRTANYLKQLSDDTPEHWDGYQPLAVTLDRSGIDHWDFSRVLWLGPDRHRCLIWSNAAALSLRAVLHLFAAEHGEKLLSGADGAGLPRPADLGVRVPGDLERHRIIG